MLQMNDEKEPVGHDEAERHHRFWLSTVNGQPSTELEASDGIICSYFDYASGSG